MPIHTREIYSVIFKDYPDILDVKQVSKLLSVSTKTVYKLISEGGIPYLKIGREFRIPKVTLMKHINILEDKTS